MSTMGFRLWDGRNGPNTLRGIPLHGRYCTGGPLKPLRPLTSLVAVWRSGLRRPMGDRESVVVGSIALAYVGAAVTLAIVVPSDRGFSPWLIAALVVAAVAISRVHFDVSTGYVSGEQLAFVPLLFLAPLPLVPLLLPLAYALSDLPDILRGRAHPHRWLNALADSWYVVGSVVVLALFAPGPPELALAGVYLAALAAQVVVGASAAVLREALVGRFAVRDELRAVVAAYQLDVLFSPVGFAVAYAAARLGPLALVSLVPLTLAVAGLGRLYRRRCDELAEQHASYWERFVGDARMLESAGQPRPGADWRCTAELALGVAAELGLEMSARAELAHTARGARRILGVDDYRHDPANHEREQRHPVEASRRMQLGTALIEAAVYQLADSVEAARFPHDRLERQAVAVRASREHFDGTGYPDGLAGEQIPRGGRVIACCEAYAAMTSGRPHREAMSKEGALDELANHSGSQFDPVMVAALTGALSGEPAELCAPVVSPWVLGSLWAHRTSAIAAAA